MTKDAEGVEIKVGDKAYAVTPRHGIALEFWGEVVEVRDGEVAVQNNQTDEVIWVPDNRVLKQGDAR